MRKKIKFTAELIIDENFYDEGWTPKSFDDAVDSDYDNIGRPLNHLEDLGWKITNKRIENVK